MLQHNNALLEAIQFILQTTFQIPERNDRPFMKGSYLTCNLAHNKHVTTQNQVPLQNASRA